MSERITLWAVYTNTDLTEGRGREHVKHFCKTQATANRLAKKGYVQGTDCPVREIEVLDFNGRMCLPTSLINVVEPTREDNAEQMRLTARQVAIEKAKAAGLTDDDLKLIGNRP